MLTVNLLLIAFLILATGFFVATEFAIVKLRPSRVDQMVMEGRKNAIAVQRVTSNLDGYLSACQLGITLTALGLGWLGKPTIEYLLYPVLEPLLPAQVVALLSFVIAFSFITFLHVVVGELAPKTLAIQKAEQVSLFFAKPIIFFYRVMYPFIWLLNGSAAALIRFFGMKPAKEHEEAHSEEELRIILTESYESGKINQAEYGYVSNIFNFDELLAREIMVPRTDMICLYKDFSLEQNLKIIKEEQYTRFPVALENKDQIVGMINTKEFFLRYADNNNLDITPLIRSVLTVSEAIPVKNLLKEMQRQRSHIAILVDEYGGTSGLVTIENILEEIVGEIRDEFDTDEKSEIEIIKENHVLVDGKVLISEMNDLLHINIEEEDLDTVGGWLYTQNPTLKEGVEWSYGDLVFIIRKKDKHRIRRIEIIKQEITAVEEELVKAE
ncbi:hemolysin family protein [Ammoniphilus sp. CFH 90114]|uniref:hemolysin family protein n=1 Tax=Ammoniphilus sp. CFH 90114 TaxID=2493665 RepID=UPI00100E0623|nr:hemolysin family protein [Ammoniphilus sp. CFH 90114]RXT03873.1 HlyC/CorC family transporter [Ammoniphilus sp. CFH 90114]